MLVRIVAGMTASGRPLLLTRDRDLLDDVRRLAVAAGVVPDVAASAADGRRLWSSASVVVVGDDVVAELSVAGLGRRPDVLVATFSADSDAPWSSALALGAERVVSLPSGEGFLVERLAAGGAGARSRAVVIGVVGGAGGAGASVLSAALAIAAGRLGHDVVLVDTDPGSGGLDLVLGAEDEPGARWCDLAAVTGLLAPEALRAALPAAHGVHLLSVDRSEAAEPIPFGAVPAVVDSAVHAYDVVVLDLPRSHPELLDTLASRCDVVLLVATPDVRGASASRRPLAALLERAEVRLVVRQVPRAGLDPDQLAEWLGLEIAAEIAHEPALTAALDRGDPPGLRARSRLGRTAADLMSVLVPR